MRAWVAGTGLGLAQTVEARRPRLLISAAPRLTSRKTARSDCPRELCAWNKELSLRQASGVHSSIVGFNLAESQAWPKQGTALA